MFRSRTGVAKQPKRVVTRRLPSQEVVKMNWRELVAEERDDACIMDFDLNLDDDSDDGDYQLSQAEEMVFMKMLYGHRYPGSEDDNDSETEVEDAEVNEDLQEALAEDANAADEGLDGDQEDNLPPSPPPESALKKSLEEEIWHLSHHYHEGLDGAWLGLPQHVEYDADVLLEPADFSDDDEEDHLQVREAREAKERMRSSVAPSPLNPQYWARGRRWEEMGRADRRKALAVANGDEPYRFQS